MNATGKDIISALCKRLEFEKKECTDTNILNLLRSLNHYEVSQLVTFKTIDKWIREINQQEEKK